MNQTDMRWTDGRTTLLDFQRQVVLVMRNEGKEASLNMTDGIDRFPFFFYKYRGLRVDWNELESLLTILNCIQRWQG